jgi:outer membrane protein OmpA-like peptidoglycan-associated protein
MLLTLLLSSALAEGPEDVEVNAQLFRPSLHSAKTLWVEDTVLDPTGMWRAGVALHHGTGLLVYEPAVGDSQEVISALTQLDLMGSTTWGLFRVGADLPVYLWANSDYQAGRPGIGDLILDGRATIPMPPASELGVALATSFQLPTSTISQGLAAPGPQVNVRGLVEYPLGRFTLLGNAGVRLGKSVPVGDLTLGSALILRTGLSYHLDPKSGLAAELASQSAIRDLGNTRASPAELMLSGWRVVDDSWVGRLGVGRGLTQGVGSPRLRLVVSVERKPMDPDPDNDGLIGLDDLCPRVPEWFNGVRDEDGCPEAASALVDGESQPGPETSDASGAERTVVLQPPRWVDPDGDGISSDLDDCPDSAEDLDEFQDGDGCPDLDNDGDGVLDSDDQCPVVAETSNGFEDDDGCPETAPQALVGISGIVRGITFKTGSDHLRPESLKVLNKVLAAMQEYPILRLQIAGHTDGQGDAVANLDLSRRRAQRVQEWLVEQGIAADRLSSAGYGEDRPVAGDDTPQGRAENRRVELTYQTQKDEK